MNTITLERKPNLMMMGREFKIYLDDALVDTIGDGEEIKIEIPEDAKELTIRVMQYSSKPLILNSKDAESYLIRQNLTSTIVSSIIAILAGIFFISKFVFEKEMPIFIYIAFPLILISVYYSTIGRSSVIQLEKLN